MKHHARLATALLLLMAGTLGGQDWPMFLGNQQLTADNDGIAPRTFAIRWSWTSRSPLYRAVPAPDGVLVTTADRQVILVSSSGETVWTRAMPAPVIRPPIVWRGYAWVLAGRSIFCLDLDDGRTIWSRENNAATQLVTPAVSDGILFHGARNGIQARNATNGRPLWENTTLSAWGAACVVIEDSLLVQHRNYRSSTSFLACLDTRSGRTRWTQPIPHEANIFPPLVVGRRVFQGANSTLAVFSLTDGRPITNLHFSAPLASHPAGTGPLLVLPLTDGTVVTLCSTNYAVLNRFSHFRRQGNALAVSADQIYCVTDSGDMVELCVTNGRATRSLPLPSAASHVQPFLRNGLLFASSQRTLVCIGPPGERKPDETIIQTPTRRTLVLIDAVTGEPLSGAARVTWHQGHSGIREAGIEADSLGSVRLPQLIPAAETPLTIQRRGYVFTSISWPKDTSRLVVRLRAIDTRTRLVMHDILFEPGSTTLLPAALPPLHRLARFMQSNPEITILIEGHTDTTGEPALNLALSRARADSIREYLVRQGVGSWRMHTAGFGSDRPVAPNTSEDGRQKNRRTEIRILS